MKSKPLKERHHEHERSLVTVSSLLLHKDSKIVKIAKLQTANWRKTALQLN